MPKQPAAPAVRATTARRSLRIATWNINSVRLRHPLIAGIVAALDPDVLCLQETKCPDELLPRAELQALGFPHVAAKGMKGYNGVAVLSRIPFVQRDNDPDWCLKGDCRHLGVELDAPGGPVELHDFYVPAGGDVPDPEVNDKFAHKLRFLDEMTAWWPAAAKAGRPAVLAGDLNIAPLEHDVWSHSQLLDVVSHTPVEVAKLAALQGTLGWIDAARTFVPAEEKLYSWWSYRAADWRASGRGRRLDHIWITPDLGDALKACTILGGVRGWEPKPSDHAPVIAELAL